MGVDPDVRTTSWAVIRGIKPLAVGIAKSSGGSVPTVIRHQIPAFEAALKEWSPDVVVIEGQFYDRSGKGSTPNDLIKLAQVAGGITGQVMSLSDCSCVIVTPMDWKGNTPKPINQTRTFSHFGILSARGAGYSYPTGCKGLSKIKGALSLNKGDWKHVADALGLARYGVRELL